MEKAQLRYGESGEPSLLVLHVPSSLAKGGVEKLVYALPILSREGGFLLAVPLQTFEDSVLEARPMMKQRLLARHLLQELTSLRRMMRELWCRWMHTQSKSCS